MRFLSRLVGDRDAASDIAQESYVRVLSLQDAGTPISDLRALLYRTARNLVVDAHRRATVRASHFDNAECVDEPVADQAGQPEQICASLQRTKALIAAIESLPPRCREAFVLFKFDELTHAEIAARMGISRNMVEKHVIRGMLACRQQLAAFDGATSTDAPIAN
ncbi:sigma-70 family RNA polymerase sigma factor [Chitinasiproducens palmae]|uniref:sigma-70 family RNA polymerase sigma factor n=1 Tax=Chitinasiproducens palmae TaxID=1770053 RepID=UPI0038B286FF